MHEVKQSSYSYTNRFLGNKSIDTYVIFHPSYLLRQQNKKKDMWLDIVKIKMQLQKSQRSGV